MVEPAKSREPPPVRKRRRRGTPGHPPLMRSLIHALVNDVSALDLHLQILTSDAAGPQAQPETIRILRTLGASILVGARALAGGLAPRAPARRADRASRMAPTRQLRSGGLVK